MGFWGIATKWVSEAWPLVGFMRHGHLVGFWGMATSYLCIFNVTQDWRSCWPHCAVSFKGMATGWVPKTWPQIGFLRKCHCHWMGGSMNGFMRHGYWMGFWGMATQWVSETWPLVGFLRVSEAWPLSGFLRHGHWLDFWSMATRWISELDVLLRHGHWVGFWGMQIATFWVSQRSIVSGMYILAKKFSAWKNYYLQEKLIFHRKLKKNWNWKGYRPSDITFW